MTDPVTGAITKAGAKATGALGKRLLGAANGARSSVQAERAVEALLAEEALERERRLVAVAVVAEAKAVLLKLYKAHRWRDVPEDERPTEDDAVAAAAELVREARRAGSNRKREVLFHAFYMRFSPEFYEDGMGKMLWQIAVDLEYPTMRALKEIADLVKEAEVREERARRQGSGHVPRGALLTYNTEEWPHVARLEGHGLIVATFHKNKNASVFISALGHAFIRFALDEYRERGYTPEAVTEE